MNTNAPWKVAAMYRFVALDNLPTLQKEIRAVCDQNDICGTLLIAPEGINGTIAGPEQGIENIIDFLDEKTGIKSASLKYSSAEEKPFRRMKVRLKKEIVTLKRQILNILKTITDEAVREELLLMDEEQYVF